MALGRIDLFAYCSISINMLTKEEIETLERDGYVSLGVVLTKIELLEINARIDELLYREGDSAGSELFDSPHIRHPKETGADRLADLVNKGSVFDVFYTHPHVLSGIQTVLGKQFKLSSLNYRAARPGHGHQKLHVDFKNAVPKGHYKVCNSLWLLDDFTNDNGATRIVPGSHKNKMLPDEVMPDASRPHPNEILIQAPAGTVVIFNSHIWHGGTINRTQKYRRSIHSYFCTLDQPQQLDQKRFITKKTRQRLCTTAQKILDVL